MALFHLLRDIAGGKALRFPHSGGGIGDNADRSIAQFSLPGQSYLWIAGHTHYIPELAHHSDLARRLKMGAFSADVDSFRGLQIKRLRSCKKMASEMGAVGFAQVYMHRSVLIECVGPAFGELDKIIREKEASHGLRCHCSYAIDRYDPLSANLLGGRYDGPVVYLMRRQVPCAMAGDEGEPLALYSAAKGRDGTVSCIHFICYPLQGEAHSADDGDFCIHELSCSSNLNYLSVESILGA